MPGNVNSIYSLTTNQIAKENSYFLEGMKMGDGPQDGKNFVVVLPRKEGVGLRSDQRMTILNLAT